ncbi:sigma-70 family RNA polymerase sigma factor [Chitinophaga sp. CC14]|uniref:sigma-70 family RNA polymerase sigma factor n=1 Tax=Chitinophaga sp. CC14 TaxID=3029199 RepID=UPI003B7D7067
MLEDNHENAQLLDQLKGDDLSAFNLLYERYRKALFIYAFRIVKDEQVCYELAHDAFIYLWQKRSGAIRDKNISSYLFSYVKSRSLNYLRDQNNKKLNALINSEEQAEHPNYELKNNSDTSILHEALSYIPSPATRNIFEMRFIQEMSYREIADSKSMNINTVYVHINAAIKILRKKLRKT